MLVEKKKPGRKPKPPKSIHVFALYNVKLNAYYKKFKERKKNHRKKLGKVNDWTPNLKYCQLFSRKADVTMSVRSLTKGWKPAYLEEDLRVVTIKLDVIITDEKVHI